MKMGGAGGGLSAKAAGLFIVSELVLIVLFALFVRHQDPNGSKKDSHGGNPAGNDGGITFNVGEYAAFQDVHVMIFVGFGFLMTFLNRYAYSSVGFNFLLAAVAVQWSILCQGFFHATHEGHSTITMKLSSILVADVATASFLIAFGVILGRLTPTQCLVMVAIQMPLFAANEHLAYGIFKANDAGGSIVVHLFGAIFGLAVSGVLTFRDGKNYTSPPSQSSDKTSNLFSMVGTLFLWIFWPSFNAAVAAPGIDQQRAVINTYLSISASVVTAFAASFLVSHERKLEMEHLQNSTLAGGVAIGAIADQLTSPFGALAIGSGIGILSVIGFKYIRPGHEKKMRVLDSCGVMHLHGIPGLVSGLISIALYPLQAGSDASGSSEATVKAAIQLKAVGATCGIALAGGIITGLIITLPGWKQLSKTSWYEDIEYFEGLDEEDDAARCPPTMSKTSAGNGPTLSTSSDLPLVHVETRGLSHLI